MGLPVFTCSSPNRSMISVPLATSLPRVPRPILASNSSMRAFGKPLGKVLKAVFWMRPAISQWPQVVSLAWVTSLHLP